MNKKKKNLEALDLKIYYQVILTVNSTWYWHQNNTKCTQYWSMANTEIPEKKKSTLSEPNEWQMNFGKLPRTQKGRVVFPADRVSETEFQHREE